MGINVLVDYIGHADLSYSMHALFEKRLGYRLYRPMSGMDWKSRGVITSTLPAYIKKIQRSPIEDNVLDIDTEIYPYSQHAISFEKFLDTQIDIIVITSWQHEEAMCKLAEQYKPKAVVVRHIANIHEGPKVCKNILLSTLEPMPAGTNFIKYVPEHAEKFTPAFSNNCTIKSYSNYLTFYPEDLANWRFFESSLPEFTFRMHGGKGEHRTVHPRVLDLSMRDCMFIWHTKAAGGCGYVLRQALACGKPCIVRKDYTKVHNTLAQELLTDGVNCIDIDPKVRSREKAIAILRDWAKPENYAEVCRKVIRKFNKDINFHDSAKSIKEWLEVLLNGVKG